MKCENCNIDHDGAYGCGRFCSSFCAHSSVGKKGKGIPRLWDKKYKKKRYCKICKKEFINSVKLYCSKECFDIGKKLNAKNKIGIKWSINPNRNTSKIGGFRFNGGRCYNKEYISPIAGKMFLNGDEIKVAKILDSLNIKWKRNIKSFLYIDLKGKNRLYYPDFYIEDINRYIEYKGWVVPKMEHKMNEVIKNHNIDLLIIYSNDKRYKDKGINLDNIEKNPNLILENVRIV